MKEEESKVVRKIKAKSSIKPAKTPVKVKKAKSKDKTKNTKTSKLKKSKKNKSESKNYFVGAWNELRQVHWTNRRATWKLTAAVLLFSLFFIIIVLLCDWLFGQLMQNLIS